MSRVAIVTPTFNAVHTLRDTYRSLVQQTLVDWSWWVVDDGSDDRTTDSLEDICRADARCHWAKRRRGPKGASTCRNQAFSAGDSEFVVFLDADDLLANDCLERRVAFMSERPDIAFGVFRMQDFLHVVGDCEREGGIVLKNQGFDAISRFLRFDFPWTMTSPMWRRSSLPPEGPFDEAYTRLQDPEMHLRALFRGVQFQVSPDQRPDCFRRVAPVGRVQRAVKTSGLAQNYGRWLEMAVREVRTHPDASKRAKYSGDLRYNVANFIREEGLQSDALGDVDALVRDLVDLGVVTRTHEALYRLCGALRRIGIQSKYVYRPLLAPVEFGLGASTLGS